MLHGHGGVGRVLKFTQNRIGGVEKRQFLIAHIDRIDATLNDGGAEAKSREQLRIERLGIMGESRNFFAFVGGKGLLQKVIPKVDILWGFESEQHGLSVDSPAKTHRLSAGEVFFALGEAGMIFSDGF